MYKRKRELKLSPSALGDFKTCPRCFWFDKIHGIKNPRGIFPSLPGGMDRQLKKYYDDCRENKTLPLELEDKVPGNLYQNFDDIDRFRSPFGRGLCVTIEGITLTGGLDDLLYDEETKLYSIIDYKTRASEPKEGATEQYYQTQGDCYDLMLNSNGMQTTHKAYFAYYFPNGVKHLRNDVVGVYFKCEPVEISTDPDRALKLSQAAIQCLRSGEMPEPSKDCEMCKHIEKRTAMQDMIEHADEVKSDEQVEKPNPKAPDTEDDIRF